MKKEKTIARYKANELPAVTERDLMRLRAAANKPIDFSDIPKISASQWKKASKPIKTRLIELPVEQDVLGWFQAHSRNYQASISQVLRHYVLSHDGMR